MFDHCYFESHMLDSEAGKDFKLLELLKARQGNAVIYCATANAVEYVQSFLSKHGVDSLRCHSRMRAVERRQNLHAFVAGKMSVLVTCEDLGEGLTDAHVRLIVHFNYPVSMRDYLAETSAAGRDGLPSRCALLFLRKDKRTQKRDPDDLREVTKYSQSAMCRISLLSKYAGEKAAGSCGRCDSCLKTPKAKPADEKKRIDLDALLEASL